MNEDTSINEQQPKSSETTQANPESDDLNQLNQFLKERDERYKLKLSQRQLNQSSTSLGGSQAGSPSLRLDDSYLKKLDSSIKRVTSFIKRLKTLTESQKDSLSKDLKQLNLSKYLSEVVAAFLEAKLKMNDLPCALHLCSLMHQSYAEFSGILFDQWQKVLNIKKDEKLANPSKLRVELRFFAELITISVLQEKESLSLLGNQLTILTTYDKDYSNLAVITSFCKHCGEDFADLVPAKFEKLANKHGVKIPRNDLYSIERQKAVKSLFKEYFKSLVQFILTENKEVQKMERQNRKLYQTKGEISSEKKEKYEQSASNFKKLIENAEILADLLSEQMPELPVDEINKRDEDLINIDIYTPNKNEEFDSNTSPWEDEDTRQFYECIPDLKSLIPGILYKPTTESSINSSDASSKTKTDESSTTTTELAITDNPTTPEDLNIEMEKIEKELQELENQQSSGVNAESELPPSITAELDEKEVETGALSTTATNNQLSGSSMKALMDSFINQLPNCVNRELIDKAAKEFCMSLNSKTNRKRLIAALFQVQRTRLDLLPFYARLVATLNPLMPELSTELAQLLNNDFRYHVRKKDQINIESKIKSARFIGELVKFNVFSKLDCLNCLKTLLADFKHHNIEMFCNLLDVCGRFLYRSAESHMKLKLLLEILMRKKQAAMSMDNRYTIMIENAFYYCNPPDSKQSDSKKVQNPMHTYIKKLLYKDLNKLCVEKILRQMRKLNWLDEEIKSYSIKCLIAAWNVRFNSIHCLANLVSGLALYYEDVGVKVVDGVIEDIQLGMEINLPKFHQRRVSMIKYLGELYNYRMIGSSIIFKSLYTIILFGVVYDVNESIAINDYSLDPIDNYFRVRLVCIILETCGQYFDRGSTKKKLDCFLLYFQRYYLFKRETSSKNASSSSTTSQPLTAVSAAMVTAGSGAVGSSNSTVGSMAKPFDPIDVESVYTECIQSLRPNFKFIDSYKEACDKVEKMQEEIKESLTKMIPNFPQILSSTNQTIDDDGLGTIREDDERQNEADVEDGRDGEHYGNQEDDDEYGLYLGANDENECDDDSRPKRSYDDDNDPGEMTKSRRDNEGDNEMGRQRFDSQNQDSNGSELEDGQNQPIVQSRKQEMSKEDEEFIKAFDSLVTENIAQRTKEAIKMPTVDIQVPMITKKAKPSVNSASGSNNEPSSVAATSILFKHLTNSGDKPETSNLEKKEAEIDQECDNLPLGKTPNKSFNFVFMTKKGNKAQYHNMEVPVASEFAQQFKAREKAEKVEKEKLKQLTLNINDRMEQEELQEMIQSVTGQFYRSAPTTATMGSSSSGTTSSGYSHNTNRDRHQKYIHPKGAPDADLIFGSSNSPSAGNSASSANSNTNRRQIQGGQNYSK